MYTRAKVSKVGDFNSIRKENITVTAKIPTDESICYDHHNTPKYKRQRNHIYLLCVLSPFNIQHNWHCYSFFLRIARYIVFSASIELCMPIFGLNNVLYAKRVSRAINYVLFGRHKLVNCRFFHHIYIYLIFCSLKKKKMISSVATIYQFWFLCIYLG